MIKIIKSFLISVVGFILITNFSFAKDYKYKKLKLLFNDDSNVYKIAYSKEAWGRISKTLSYLETNKSNELVSGFVGFHLPIESNPRWVMDTMRDLLLQSDSPLANVDAFNFHKKTTSRHLFIGEINLKKMRSNSFFNLQSLINKAQIKYNVVFPRKLLSSIHVSINTKGIYFVTYFNNHNLNQKVNGNQYISLNPAKVKANPSLSSFVNDWVALSLARENILTKSLKLKPLDTGFEIKHDEDYYIKKFKENNLNKIAKNKNDDISKKDKDVAKLDEEKKKKELLAQKNAEEEKKKKELLAQKNAEIQTEEDTTPPTIITAENVIVKSSSYKIIGILEDAGSDNLYIDIDGMTVEAKNGKFVIQRFSPIDETVRLIAIDQWGNKSEPVFVNVKVNQEKKIITEKLEKLDPTKVNVKLDENKVALIFGIEKYNQTPAASYANKDAQYFYEYAKKVFGVPEKNIELLIDEKANLIESLGRVNKWLPAKIKKTKTDLVIFFAGHGLASPDGKDLYLLSQDSDPDLLSRTALSRSELFETILKYNPKSVTMFFDTCFSGISRDEKTLLASARPVRVVADEDESSLPKNFSIFSASQLDQISSGIKEAEHGIFSYYLMKGLEGYADLNKDKKITNGELLSYMDEKISVQASTLGREQNPSLTGDPNRVLVRFN